MVRTHTRSSTHVRRRVAAIVTAVAAATAGIGLLGAGDAAAGGPPAYTVVVEKEGCFLARIDLTNGDVAPLGAAANDDACVSDLTVAPDGAVYGLIQQVVDEVVPARTVALVKFDPASGAVESSEVLTGSFTNSALVQGRIVAAGLAFTPDGVLYVLMLTNETGCDSGCIYRVDPATRVATLVGPAGLIRSSAFILAVSCAGDTASGVLGAPSTPDPEGTTSESIDTQEAVAAGPDTLASVNLSDGQYTLGPAFDVPDRNLALFGGDFEHPGSTLYGLIGPGPIDRNVGPAASGFAVATIDRTTGVITPVADATAPALGLRLLAIGGTCVTETPEPAPIVIQPTFTG